MATIAIINWVVLVTTLLLWARSERKRIEHEELVRKVMEE